MGYPDKVQDIYDKLVFNAEDTLYNIVHTLKEIKILENLEELTKPTDPKNGQCQDIW